jgi:hypothetical protein
VIEITRSHVVTRLVWLIVAALQISLGVVATVAEAHFLVDAELADASLHVEPEGPLHNPPVHPDNCAVCQYLTSRSSQTDTFELSGLTWIVEQDDILPAHSSYALRGGLVLPLPRAPPAS